jgi:RimJ/RimL family protein N-acetyltransferase
MEIPGFEVRAIGPEELDAWWDLRLRGLRDHPDAFGADYKASKVRGPEHLRPSTRKGGGSRLFAAFTDTGQLVAQAAVARQDGKRSHIAMIYSVHTDAGYRGLGLSKALIARAVEYCRALPGVRQVGISVNSRNLPAIAVYKGAGFVAWGTEPRALATGDGFHDEIHMTLMLDVAVDALVGE